MSEPFLSEIRMMSFEFAPRGWALCNGQLLPINQNQALFSLLGTNFGGDGRINFALPDLRGRTPIHVGAGYSLGQRGGEQSHTLTVAELPQHAHQLRASSGPGTGPIPADAMLAVNNLPGYHAPEASSTTLASASIANTGSSQPHQNMQPFLTISFCIALQGIFPSQN